MPTSRVANGTRHRLILDQQNDIVRRIPYTHLMLLYANLNHMHLIDPTTELVL